MADLTDNLTKAELEPIVIETIKTVNEEEDLLIALNIAKKDPKIAADLAKDLALAKTDEEVATAIVNADTANRLTSALQDTTQL